VIASFLDTFDRHGIRFTAPPVEERLSEAQLLPLVSDIDGAICGDDAFTDRVLSHAPRLRVISKWGTGIDSIDRESCRRRGIAVRNTPNAFTEPVSDTTLGYMLSWSRQLHRMAAEMRSGRWFKIPGRTLGESTVGLIGVGNIGRAVAKRLVPFGARTLAYDPVPPPADILEPLGVALVDKARLLAECDIVSLHCDLNPTSFHAIDAAAVAGMKTGAFLINTARGPIVDEPALVEGLQSSKLGGAALDVFEDEPLPPASPLRGMPNVLLAPHNSNSSPRAWEHVHRRTVQNLIDVLVKPS
jgi:D-3-phosphoglycerate dehydrogenase